MSVNIIDNQGIQTKSIQDVVDSLTAAFQTIYGSDVNLDQNSPDGQLIYNFALIIADILSLIVQDYSSKDPDQAVGVALDAVSQLCGLTRLGGTYTEVDIDVTADRSLNLNGLTETSPFTVTDGINVFQLIDNESLTAGVNTLAFRCTEIGNVQISKNTITNISTPILGVTEVNNPNDPTQQGTDQETDLDFRIRRQKAVSLPANCALAGLLGGLQTVTDLVEAIVYENTDSSPDGDSIPGHGIWVIVDGGSDEDVADMIYKYRPLGIPMKGSESVSVTQADGSTITIQFDRAVEEDLYVFLTITSKSGGIIDEDAIKEGLVDAMTYGINEIADVSSIIAAIYQINPDAVVGAATVAIYGETPASTFETSSKQNKFVLSTDNITIS